MTPLCSIDGCSEDAIHQMADNKEWLCVMHLGIRLDAAERERSLAMQVIKEDCEDQAELRKTATTLVGDFLANGDSEGVPTPADVMESVAERFKLAEQVVAAAKGHQCRLVYTSQEPVEPVCILCDALTAYDTHEH